MQCNNLFLFKTNSPCPRFSVVEDTVSNFSHGYGYKQNIQSACSKTNNPPPPSASLPPSVTRGDVTDIQPMAAAQTPACTCGVASSSSKYHITSPSPHLTSPHLHLNYLIYLTSTKSPHLNYLISITSSQLPHLIYLTSTKSPQLPHLTLNYLPSPQLPPPNSTTSPNLNYPPPQLPPIPSTTSHPLNYLPSPQLPHLTSTTSPTSATSPPLNLPHLTSTTSPYLN